MSRNTQENMILTRLRDGLRNRLGVGEDECYVTAVQTYVEGQNEKVIQIIPGSTSPESSQTGGSLLRKMSITLAFWYRLKIDMHRIHEQQLMEQSEGFADWIEGVRQLLGLTSLAQSVLGPLVYEGKSQAMVGDEDAGVLVQTLNYSAVYAEELPRYVTLTDADVVSVLTP